LNNFESTRIIRYKLEDTQVKNLFVTMLCQIAAIGETARQLYEAINADGHKPAEFLKELLDRTGGADG
jgi:hypothetical protein